MIPPLAAGLAVRQADAAALAAALRASRDDTLATFDAVRRAWGDRPVPQRDTLNPPLWELGHLGWFQEVWIARHAARDLGVLAPPHGPRGPGVRANADALYDSSHVAHAARWHLPLPDTDGTRHDLAAQLATTLALLSDTPDDDAALYFYRLALLHEDMHHEASLALAHALGVPIDDARWQPVPRPSGDRELAFDAGPWSLGVEGAGFAFDNELGAHRVDLPATRIDRQVLRWSAYLPFIEAGGYAQAALWTAEGARWLADTGRQAPRDLRHDGDAWRHWHGGRWAPLDPAWPASALSLHEAQAWCRWAGRRLPSEGEWERAAVERPDDFHWGEVWEWTASTFAPYPGFTPHPYRDYSLPWFGDRPVLRGASYRTQPRMRHPRYRNFYRADRNDVAAGFRTCRL